MIAMMMMAISLTLTGWGSIPAVLIPTLTGWGLAGRGWMPEWGGVFNHLWQSTVFAAVAALLALALRKNHARARYWLWLTASCKFLVPFSLLVALGTGIGGSTQSIIEKLWPTARAIVVQPEVTVMFDEISQPFTQVSVPAAAPEHRSILAAILPELLFGLWIAGCAIVLISWFRRWLRVRAAVGAAKPIHFELPAPHPLPDGRGSVIEWRTRAGEPEHEAGLPARLPAPQEPPERRLQARLPAPHGIRIMSSPALLEPGIFGIFRPVLLLPEGIADRLTPKQLQSILAHELCHVKRRDNLAAAMHMIVEAAFWFHPLVWWIGARLVEERERACDEEVLRSGSEPGVYAESILQVCKFYLESPLKCVAGVTGSDLKKRIESIMSGLPGRSLTPARKLMLIAASIGAIGAPIVIGLLNAPRMRAQSGQSPTDTSATPKWEVVSVKPCDPSTPQGRSGGGGGGGFSPGTLTANCAVPMRLIEEAYGFFANGRAPTWKSVPIEGAPSWLNSERYTIAAKAESPQGRAMMFGPMMQKLLEDRFKLTIRREIREVPVYNLTIAKGGPRNLKASKPGTCVALNVDTPPPPSGDLCKMFMRRRVAEGEREFKELSVTMAEFSDALASMTGRNVIDKTGLPGDFDIEVQVSVPDEPPRDPSQPRTGPDDESDLVFAVVQKLGMKLESAKGPGVVYVIEHVERPSDNYEPQVAALQASDQPGIDKTATPKFEVASIKAADPNVRGSRIQTAPGGRYIATGVTVKFLIAQSYGVRDFQISGGPSWIDSQRYDINAKGESGIENKPGQMALMIQDLLADRFHLKLTRETKEMPIYALVLAKNGAKLKDSVVGAEGRRMQTGRGRLEWQGVDMANFATQLSQQLGRTVLDKTGLTGNYDFKLEWTPDLGQQQLGPREIGGPEVAPPVDSSGPTIFTALQEQLGLKLEAQKGPVEILVIDRAEKPSDNFEPPIAAVKALGEPAPAFVSALAKPAKPAVAFAIQAQAHDGPSLSFEVASIKPAPEVRFPSWSISRESGRLNATTDVKGLVEFAYGLHMGQVSGGPSWMSSEKYAVVAKAAGPSSLRELQRMTRSLLADRLKLTIHRETKELPVLALVVGNRGPKLTPSKFESDDDSGITIRSDHGVGHMTAQRTRMDAFVVQLMGNTGTDRIVVDQTGLKGAYDFKLDWSPERPAGSPGDGSDPVAPTIFTALQEQLGLRLESTKAPIEIVVIDHVEKPSDNFEPPAKQEHALHTVAPLGAPQIAVVAKPQSQPASPGGKPLAFEVATIRPSKAETGDRELSNQPGRRLSAANATLKMLIMLAYQVTANELSGGPGWMASDGFDIEAKPENPNATPEQFRQMIQKLLEERFQLKSHFETKEIPIYTLVVGKRAKLQESKGNEPDVIMRNSYGLMTGVKATMPMFASALSKRLKRQVVDETGLKGAYNFKLEFTPEPDQKGSDPDEHHAPPPGDHPSIFTALQEQLGLNLKAGKGPVQVLMIDHAEKPTDNSTAPAAKQGQALHSVAPQSRRAP